MSTYLPAPPEDAGDQGHNPFQRRKSIDKVVVTPDSQRKAPGMQLIATAAAVPRHSPQGALGTTAFRSNICSLHRRHCATHQRAKFVSSRRTDRIDHWPHRHLQAGQSPSRQNLPADHPAAAVACWPTSRCMVHGTSASRPARTWRSGTHWQSASKSRRHLPITGSVP
jgi:hypothetical protein